MLQRTIPVTVFVVLLCALALAQPVTDTALFFIPAAHILAHGGDAYALHSAVMPFVYPPWVMPLFVAYGLPGAYVLAILANGAAALWITRAQRASYWWLLYPPVLTACWFGTFDLLVVALALLAYRRRNPALMAVALLIKPQAAIFWCVPLLIEQPRLAWRIAAVGAGVVGASLLLMPGAWGSWLAAVGAHPTSLATHYAVGGYSVFALGALGIGHTLARMREGQWRALTALTVPFIRQYSAVGLLGYGPTWVIALAWLLAGLAVFGVRALWIEPVVVLVWWWYWNRRNGS